MELVLSAVSMGRALRNKHQLKIRQPLASIFLVTRDPEAVAILNDMEELITEELNIKKVVVADNEEDLVTYSAKANYSVLGPKLGVRMKQVARTIVELDSSAIFRLRDGKRTTLELDGETIILAPEDVLLQRHEKEGLLAQTENNVTVALNTELTIDLQQEGFAREFVNKVQNMRKEQAFDVMARIHVRYQTSQFVQTAVTRFDQFIKTETLANHLEAIPSGHLMSGRRGAEWDINGEACAIEVQRA